VAIAEAGLGRHEEALRSVKRALEIQPVEADALSAPRATLVWAEVLAMAGDREGALRKLEEIVKLPFAVYHGDLKLHPVWDELRGDPRFDALIAESAKPL
jgi:tetratricopeptide (TPR) repeat protein